jgi:energy-coupling factor transport system ATP-binding protein
MSGAILALDDVAYAYPRAAAAALDGVSLEVSPGEGVALLGPNGAGKTTLTRLAVALLAPARGVVRVAGRATRGLAPEDLAAAAGYLFQHPEAQLFARSVRAELAFGLERQGWEAERVERRVHEVLAELDLASCAETHPYDLPAPRRRIVALGAALAAGPALLILDEPTAGLDRAGRELVQRVVAARRAAGTAVLAVTHDMAFALEALDRAVVLRAGRLVRDAPLADVLGGPGDPHPLPPHAELARRLGLGAPSLRLADVARALAVRCRSGAGRDMFRHP